MKQVMDQKPTIVIFSHAYLPFLGGAETAVKGIADELGGFNFVMLTGKYKFSLSRKEKLGNIMVYRLGFGFSVDKFLLPILVFLKFIFLKRKLLKPLSFWGIMISYSSIGAYFLKFLYPKVPFLLTVQEGNREWERNRFWWRLLLKKVDYVTAISSFLLERAGEAGYHRKAEVVPNGVDLEKFSNPNVKKTLILSQKLGIKPDEKIIITVSRLTYKNAVDIIVRAMSFIKTEARLLIVGGGEEEKKLKKLAREFKVENKIVFAAGSHDEIPAYLKLGHVFVRPSRSEGLGTAFLEAMAAGLPIIATSVGGIKDFLKDGETGLEVKVDDPEDLARKLDLLFSDEALRQKLIQNGQRLVEEKYQWSQIAAKMRDIFNSLL